VHLADSSKGLQDAHAPREQRCDRYCAWGFRNKHTQRAGSALPEPGTLPPPHAISFVIGTAVINTHTPADERILSVAQ
jgi:hypothetical protein